MEVMILVEYSIPIPEEVKEKLDHLSKYMGIRMEAVVLFSVIRYLEVQMGDPGPNVLALLLRGGT